MSKIPYSNLNFAFLSNRVSRLLKKTALNIAHQKQVSVPIQEMGIIADLKNKEGVLQQDLAESLIRNKSSITKMLERLENDGFIRKEADEEDGRAKRIYLTEKGNEMSELMTKIVPDVRLVAYEGLQQKEMEIALKVLNKIYNNLLRFNSK